ncbi:TPA: Gfo/Idh/MocA family oxidoreductase [Candidatus Poribacteria bacterium]|nr:Gfo/Idh/MocA family oxidoreductase [Candidatus Poribacteria bacterium]
MKLETRSDKVTLGMVGIGYWGPNLLRNFTQLDKCWMKICCDIDEKSLKNVQSQYPGIKTTKQYSDLIDDPEIQAIIISAPAIKHYEFAKLAIQNNKHVFVEKPLTLNIPDAEDLVRLAKEKNVKLMVGHLMEYHPAIEKLKQMIQNNELGEIYYIYSQRVNLGRIRKDENALWSLAPHDISIIMYLLESEPVMVNAIGKSYIQDGIEDVAFLNMTFPNNIMAHVQLSWLDPHKIRMTTIVGSKKMAVFNDMDTSEMIKVYDKGVENNSSPGSFGESLVLRFGDVVVPYIKMVEPLRLECQHFIDCIINDKQPRSDGIDGLKVVKVLHSAQKSLKNGGIPIPVGE